MATEDTKRKYLVLCALAESKQKGLEQKAKNPDEQLRTSMSISAIGADIEVRGNNLFGHPHWYSIATGFENFIEEMADLGFIKKSFLSNYFITADGEQYRQDVWRRFIQPELIAKHIRPAPAMA